ncbi:hypothetical protein CRG98_032660 [Punica granatum]|uniref:K Homology domain-containing protein n=1 Tax=Punica granatum TaxID=22663 RepID=A0A2I0ISI1_PUNGR|nr:hypothetical protein CRG98_032660 [Punica granatum]
MAGSLTPSKRPSEGNFTEPNGKRKVQNSSTTTSPGKSSKSSPGSTIFRVLCPASEAYAIIGNNSSFILQIRQETGSNVLVEEAVPGCDERVIFITGADVESNVVSQQNQEGKRDEGNGNKGDEDMKENAEDGENKGDQSGEDCRAGVGGASLQKALLLVFEKLVEGQSTTEDNNGDANKSASFIFRLLVLSSQVGCLLGKAGSVIKQMTTDSGAEIRILPKDGLPPLASASDELVQIAGEVDAVRIALRSVSQQLIENATRDRETFLANPSSSSSHSSGNSLPKQESHHISKHYAAQRAASFGSRPRGIGDFHPHVPPLISRFHENGHQIRMKPSLDMLSFRLLCTSDRVGGIIGKGGAVVNAIQQETGCEIHAVEGPPDSGDRIIVISGPAVSL